MAFTKLVPATLGGMTDAQVSEIVTAIEMSDQSAQLAAIGDKLDEIIGLLKEIATGQT
jgi:hypothetical protein